MSDVMICLRRKLYTLSAFLIGCHSGHPDQVRLQRSHSLGSCYSSVNTGQCSFCYRQWLDEKKHSNSGAFTWTCA
ncbi:hypothetical protein EJ04DRAFT_196569 [Polyplosphaeria fusca]|uniref:Uncharacterized protein n=1 Tax=Polyplosphaeria fusca TaxID=682080 RepID=A0A9P4V9A6_9PLEO|nr:hypothetical protein EJ04DRAFT_196569 [Polyplosphaeria fusca]